ncbi:MAG: glpQ1, partial [Gammaproteobacteria bacterium]|nr:glpQ1 [Gammaproteobacteria bacterium]
MPNTNDLKNTEASSRGKLLKIARILSAVSIVLIIIYHIQAGRVQPIPRHPVFEHQRPLVLAHRGGRGLWPENTLYAFRHAVTLGADALDFDIHSLNDGALVVLHDDTVDRTTDGRGNVRDFALAELQKLDAGYHWTTDDGQSYPYRGQGIAIPTLVEVFTEFPQTRMNIEIKQPNPDTTTVLCRLIHDHGLQDKVVIASFSSKVMQEFRQRCPDVATAAAAGEAWPFYILTWLHLGRIYHPDAETMQVPAFRNDRLLLDHNFIGMAHTHNMEVYAWTINDVKEMETLLQLGVNGIITDYPDRLLELTNRKDASEK